MQNNICFLIKMEYLNRQFKQENIKVRYSQAVTSFGKSNESINFKKLKLTKAVCIYHKGLMKI